MRGLHCDIEPFIEDRVDLFHRKALVGQKNVALQRRFYPYIRVKRVRGGKKTSHNTKVTTYRIHDVLTTTT